ncbi:unnamed protein product, partial [Amoebophrya sp. A25]|eukprot:GSA25T00000429001.1
MLESPVWDKYSVRVPLGAELCNLLLSCCPVQCEYEEAKHLLSEEQKQEWKQQKQEALVRNMSCLPGEGERLLGDTDTQPVQ